MKFSWEFSTPKGRILTGDHESFDASRQSFERLHERGMFAGPGTNVALWKPCWADVERIVIDEYYDDAGWEGRLRRTAYLWREFFRNMGRRITVVAMKYVFPEDRYPQRVDSGATEDAVSTEAQTVVH